ncbi:Hypothetical predicted protein [Marmota monax]|uniref:Uncharacterized protein n=1 Tax=Marmota monax TaxID=9995 RepID=A0A5E4BNY5_MARMO|nr:Hypothetical predicted protein [Marmota monax]
MSFTEVPNGRNRTRSPQGSRLRQPSTGPPTGTDIHSGPLTRPLPICSPRSRTGPRPRTTRGPVNTCHPNNHLSGSRLPAHHITPPRPPTRHTDSPTILHTRDLQLQTYESKDGWTSTTLRTPFPVSRPSSDGIEETHRREGQDVLRDLKSNRIQNPDPYIESTISRTNVRFPGPKRLRPVCHRESSMFFDPIPTVRMTRWFYHGTFLSLVSFVFVTTRHTDMSPDPVVPRQFLLKDVLYRTSTISFTVPLSTPPPVGSDGPRTPYNRLEIVPTLGPVSVVSVATVSLYSVRSLLRTREPNPSFRGVDTDTGTMSFCKRRRDWDGGTPITERS